MTAVVALVTRELASNINEREKYVSRIRLILVAALAVFALSAVAASSASAAGPLWLNASGKLASSSESLLALGLNLGHFTLTAGSLITILCEHLHAHTTLLGGMPAKDDTHLHFLNCTVVGHPNCTVNSPGAEVGLILVSGVKSEVVYLGTQTEAEAEKGKLGDLFTPSGGKTSGETFVELVIGGSGCPLFTKGEQEVKGSVIGEITPVNSMGTEGKQIFPSTAIKSAWRWLGKGSVEEVTAGLDVFGVIEAIQSGEADIWLENGEEWGVTTK